MSSGVNTVILIGHLGKDPEVRYVANGKAVCTLRLAMSERRKDGDNGWKDHTEWMDVVCWDKTAENAGQYLAKGRQVYVEGRLQTREYKDKDGNDRHRTEVVASQVLFLGGNPNGEAKPTATGGPQTPRAASASGAAAAAPQSGTGFVDEDLPF